MSEPVIRFMRLKDVDAVAAIEKETFARPWSLESFRQETARVGYIDGKRQVFSCQQQAE